MSEQPSKVAMAAAVDLEIQRALGNVQTVEIGRMIQKAIDARTGWRPIETAPKDGTPIIIAECTDLSNGNPHWYIDTAVNYYETDIRAKDAWVEREGSEVVCDNPTHWMPLPAPPVEAKSEVVG